MKKLLHVLYITEPDTALRLDGQTVLVCHQDGQEDHIPLHLLEGIVSVSHIPPTQALIKACVRNQVDFVSISASGRFQYRIVGETRGNVLLRKRQYLLAEDQTDSLELAKVMILGKIDSSAKLLSRFRRNHAEIECLHSVEERLRAMKKLAKSADTEQQLRGIEGMAAREYFNVFDKMLLTEEPVFRFGGRSRKPPKDRCNALLSFVYTLLTAECVCALECAGLDPYVGFLHGERPGKASLALDIMEELRPMVADRFILRLVNLQMIHADQFVPTEDGGIHLSQEGRRILLREWSRTRGHEIKTMEFDNPIPLGLLPFLQAQKLSGFLRGERQTYTNIEWR